MQQELIAGDSLNFPTAGGKYPANDGWVLTYTLVPRTVGGTVITITATAEGADFRVAVAAGTTANWTADSYSWAARVDKAGERYTVDSGQIVILPELAAASAGYDSRSLARRTLDDLRAAFASFSASRGVQRRYKIGEREMEFSSAAEIIKLLTWWEQQVANEDRLAGRAEQVSRRIYSRI